MLTTLAFLAALPLAPAQQGTLSLTNPRFTFGLLGPARADVKALPGDIISLQFDIENASLDKEGKVKYSTSLEILDPSGKSIFTQPPRDEEYFNTLGGTSLPGSASVFLKVDQTPGDYTLKVNVKDQATQKTATLSQKFTVLPRGLGFVGISTSSDPDMRVPAGVLSVGESLFINTAVIGFMRGGAAKQPNLTVEMTVLDDAGKPTLPKPFTAVVDDRAPKEQFVDEKAFVVPFQFLVSLNRAGKFTAELKVTDNLAKKTVTQKIPFTVVPR